MLISISILNTSKYMRERSRHECDKIIFNMYFIFHISYHATLEKEKMSVIHVRTICHSVHYIVRTDIVRTSVRTTHNRTYLFLSYTFFSAIKNVVSSISTGVPLKILQPSLSHTTKPIFLRFFFYYSSFTQGE